jgi:hypothetical protein
MVALARDPRTQCPLEPEPVRLAGTEQVLAGPLAVLGGESLSALVEVNVVGDPDRTEGAVVLQRQAEDGTWQDVTGSAFDHVGGLRLFVLAGGARTPRRPPGAALGPPVHRVRFVGRVRFTGGQKPRAAVVVRWKRMERD